MTDRLRLLALRFMSALEFTFVIKQSLQHIYIYIYMYIYTQRYVYIHSFVCVCVLSIHITEDCPTSFACKCTALCSCSLVNCLILIASLFLVRSLLRLFIGYWMIIGSLVYLFIIERKLLIVSY